MNDRKSENLLRAAGRKFSPGLNAAPRGSRRGHYAPKYVELANLLLRHIADEGLQQGDRLGTEAELGQRHGVSRVTVRQALAVLEKDGFISRHKARGTFVKTTIDHSHHLGVVRGTVVVACSNEQAGHEDEDFAFSTVLRAIERELAKRGFMVQILGIGEDQTADQARLRQLERRNDIEGFCAIGPCLKRYLELVGDQPIVTSGTFVPDRLPWVGQEARAACRESVEFLIRKGHRDVALICGEGVDREAFSVFAEGYREAFEKNNLPCQRGLMFHVYPGEPLERLTREVLGSSVRPTAIFAENWRVCEVVLKVARELGLRIPEDFSLIAYGQNVLQISSPVAITAYVPDSKEIGKQVAQIFNALLNGEETAERAVAVPGNLYERDSVRILDSLSTVEPGH